MSEEAKPVKKAARKSTRKKVAAKKTASQPVEEVQVEAELATVVEAVETVEVLAEAEKTEEVAKKKVARRTREPRSGVRDTRKEPENKEEEGSEVVEMLVTVEENEDSGAGVKVEKDEKSQESGRRSGRTDGAEKRSRNRGRNRGEREKREPKVKVEIDEEELSKKAWRIFYSEVTEEGLALLDDNGLREFAKGSFNAAKVFLEEKGRVEARIKGEKQYRQKSEGEKSGRDED